MFVFEIYWSNNEKQKQNYLLATNGSELFLGNKKGISGGTDSCNVILVVHREKELPDGKPAPAVLDQEEDGQGEAEEEADEAEEGGDEGDVRRPDGGRGGDQGVALPQLRLASD